MQEKSAKKQDTHCMINSNLLDTTCEETANEIKTLRENTLLKMLIAFR